MDRPEFKDPKLRQLLAGFLHAAICERHAQKAPVDAAFIDRVLQEWNKLFELYGAVQIMELGDKLGGRWMQ